MGVGYVRQRVTAQANPNRSVKNVTALDQGLQPHHRRTVHSEGVLIMPGPIVTKIMAIREVAGEDPTHASVVAHLACHTERDHRAYMDATAIGERAVNVDGSTQRQRADDYYFCPDHLQPYLF